MFSLRRAPGTASNGSQAGGHRERQCSPPHHPAPQELSVESQTVLVISGPLLPTTVTITGSFAGGIVLGLTLTYSFFLSFQVLTWVLLFFFERLGFPRGMPG